MSDLAPFLKFFLHGRRLTGGGWFRSPLLKMKVMYNPNRIVSNCCGSDIDDMHICNGYGKCPECKEDCVYVTQREFDDNDYDQINTELTNDVENKKP